MSTDDLEFAEQLGTQIQAFKGRRQHIAQP